MSSTRARSSTGKWCLSFPFGLLPRVSEELSFVVEFESHNTKDFSVVIIQWIVPSEVLVHVTCKQSEREEE